MTRYILDTDVLINASKKREPDSSWILDRLRDGDRLSITAVSVAEYYSGVDAAFVTPFDTFIEQLPCVGITRDIGRIAGGFRYTFARRGIPLSTTDCLIAAAAHRAGATLVTHNAKDYPMSGVTVLAP